MSERLYTVEQVAALLEMHPKTIQKYIRDGRLKANKVGKGWRVSGHDLSRFVEGTADSPPAVPRPEPRYRYPGDKIKVSAVLDIDVAGIDESMRIVNQLTAALNNKPPEFGPSTMTAQFIEPEHIVRIMLWGNIVFIQAMIDMLNAYTGSGASMREGHEI